MNKKEWYDPIFIICQVIRDGVYQEIDRTQSLQHGLWLFHHLIQANHSMDFVIDEYDAYYSEDAPDNVQLRKSYKHEERPFKKKEYVEIISTNNESPLAGLI